MRMNAKWMQAVTHRPGDAVGGAVGHTVTGLTQSLPQDQISRDPLQEPSR